MEGGPVAPHTTAEEDRQSAGVRSEGSLRSAGQRHINAMWERTQQIIAIAVTINVLTVCAFLVWHGDAATAVPAFMLLSNVFFLVIGTYIQRTNHTKRGGVGADEEGR